MANAGRQGFHDPRTMLFYQTIRIIKELRKEKHRVHYLNENVASMTGADRDQFTKLLGVRPVKACAGDISQARRERYYWII